MAGALAAVGASTPSLLSDPSFHTAEEYRTSRFTIATFTTYYSVQDSAVVKIAKISDFHRAFRDLNVTSLVRNVAAHPSGFGGSADVRQADLVTGYRSSGLRVALKIPRAINVELDLLKKLAREIAVWRTLSHRNILPLCGLDWSMGSLPAMVSPWYKNGSIISYVAAQASSPLVNAYTLRNRLLEDALHGLAHLHGLMIVHGDLKGANILVSDEGVACLADFGVSAVLSQYPLDSATAVGTYRWMAPELLRDGSSLTWQSDIWAYGCVILEVASGQRPFHAISDEPKVIIALHEGQTPPRPPRVPDALWDLSRTCCARTTRQRPTAEDVIARLRAVSAVPSVSTAAHSAPAVSRTLRRASAIRIPRPQWDTSPELNPTAESPSKIRKPGRFEGWVDLCA